MGISFRKALLGALGQSGLSLEELAEASGVSLERLGAVVSTEETRMPVAEAEQIAQVFGVSLVQFLEAPEVAGHIEIARLYSALPPLLKAQLEAYGPALPDDEDQPR